MSSKFERIVLDTNVLVSAFLNPNGTPAQLLTLVLAGELKLLFDERIMAEYAEVLARRALISIRRTWPKFCGS